jgi:hypothetical protein
VRKIKIKRGCVSSRFYSIQIAGGEKGRQEKQIEIEEDFPVSRSNSIFLCFLSVRGSFFFLFICNYSSHKKLNREELEKN